MVKINLPILSENWTDDPASPPVLYDRMIVWLALSLMLIGLVMVSSASIAVSTRLKDVPFFFAHRQAIYLTMAIILAFSTMQISLAKWQTYSTALLGFSLFLIIIVLFIGNSVNGATRWLSLGFINIQPAEIAKFSMLVFVASYLVRKQQEVQERFIGFLKPIGIFLMFAVFILAQPDLGSVVVMFITLLGMLFIAGARLWQFFLLFGVAANFIILLIILEPYRLRRVTSFLDPWQDPFGSGYQLTQSLMAFGRGGWFGQGLGNSIQKLEYLPEAHTDFVIAVLAEEFGFIGVMVVIGLIFALACRALYIAHRCLQNNKMPFGGFIALGIGIWMIFQTVVNIGAAAGMIPTKGLTLPLISYGGSSLLVMSVAVALLLRVDHEFRLSTLQPHQRRKGYVRR